MKITPGMPRTRDVIKEYRLIPMEIPVMVDVRAIAV